MPRLITGELWLRAASLFSSSGAEYVEAHARLHPEDAGYLDRAWLNMKSTDYAELYATAVRLWMRDWKDLEVFTVP